MIHRREFALIGNQRAVPVDPCFERMVHGIDEIAAMESRVESKNAASQEPLEDLSVPRADGIALRIGPRDMPKRDNGCMRQLVSHDLGYQREMVILNKHDRVVGLGFLDD